MSEFMSDGKALSTALSDVVLDSDNAIAPDLRQPTIRAVQVSFANEDASRIRDIFDLHITRMIKVELGQ